MKANPATNLAHDYRGTYGTGANVGLEVEWIRQDVRHVLTIKPQGGNQLIVASVATIRRPCRLQKNKTKKTRTNGCCLEVCSSAVSLYQFKQSMFNDTHDLEQTDQLEDDMSSVEVSKSLRNSNPIIFDTLPWEDVIFTHIFRHLPLTSLFRVRGLSHVARSCVDQYFASCPEVNLTLIAKKFTPAAFHTVMQNNTVLQTLILRNCKDWLVDDVIQPALLQQTHLKKIDLTSCNSLSPLTVLRLASNSPNLQELYLRDCQWMTKEALMTLALNCPKLCRLDLTGCWNLDDEALIFVSVHCRRLNFLSIAKIYGITDYAVRSLAFNCRDLQHINMRGCWRVTDDTIQLIGEYCQKLRGLQVRDCRDVTEVSLARLRRRGVKVDIPQHPWRMSQSSSLFLQKLKLQV